MGVGVPFSAWPGMTRRVETGALERGSPCTEPQGHSPQGLGEVGGLEGPQTVPKGREEVLFAHPHFCEPPAKARPSRGCPHPTSLRGKPGSAQRRHGVVSAAMAAACLGWRMPMVNAGALAFVTVTCSGLWLPGPGVSTGGRGARGRPSMVKAGWRCR